VDVGQEDPQERVVPSPEFDSEIHGNANLDVQPFIVENPSWSIVGIAREGEVFEPREYHVVRREVDDASYLDPPKTTSADRPR